MTVEPNWKLGSLPAGARANHPCNCSLSTLSAAFALKSLFQTRSHAKTNQSQRSKTSKFGYQKSTPEIYVSNSLQWETDAAESVAETGPMPANPLKNKALLGRASFYPRD